MREEKKKLAESLPDANKDDALKDQKDSDSKKRKVTKKEQDLIDVYSKPLEGGKDEKEKLNNYYRSRHASFLNALKDNIKNKKQTEEFEKKKKDELLVKIREKMGINNITSKVFEIESKQALGKEQTEPDSAQIEARERGRKSITSDKEHDRCLSADNPDTRLTLEAQHKLLEKQKQMLAKLVEKKKAEQLEEENESQKKNKVHSDCYTIFSSLFLKV